MGAWLGITGLTVTPAIAKAMDLDAGQTGALVGQVVPDSPADEAGLRPSQQVVEIDGEPLQVGGDVIISLDEKMVASMEDLRAIMQAAHPGEEVILGLLRSGIETEAQVTLGESPAASR